MSLVGRFAAGFAAHLAVVYHGGKGSLSKNEFQREHVLADRGDTVSTSIRNVEQRSNHRPIVSNGGSLIKDYVEGNLRIHLHWLGEQGQVTEKSPGGNYCVVLECPPLSDALVNYSPRIQERWKREIERLHKAAGKMQRAVLVDIRQLIEMPKRTLCALPCRERLERFDKSCGLTAHPGQHFEAVHLKFGGLIENRELGTGVIGGGLVRGVDDKLIHKMIEGRTNVVEDFANNDAPHRFTWFFHNHPDCEIRCPAYALDIEGRLVRAFLKEEVDFSLERLDLLVGPLHFQTDAIDGGQHDASR